MPTKKPKNQDELGDDFEYEIANMEARELIAKCEIAPWEYRRAHQVARNGEYRTAQNEEEWAAEDPKSIWAERVKQGIAGHRRPRPEPDPSLVQVFTAKQLYDCDKDLDAPRMQLCSHDYDPGKIKAAIDRYAKKWGPKLKEVRASKRKTNADTFVARYDFLLSEFDRTLKLLGNEPRTI